MSKSLVQTIEEMLTPCLNDLGYEIVDVEISGGGGKKILRIFIDYILHPVPIQGENLDTSNKSVTLDDCEKASVAIDEVLNKSTSLIDFLKNPYVLEVSSPGIDRVLKKPRDFIRFQGKLVRISVFEPVNGSRNFVGRIVNFENDLLTLSLLPSQNDKSPITASFTLKSIARARLEPDVEI